MKYIYVDKTKKRRTMSNITFKETTTYEARSSGELGLETFIHEKYFNRLKDALTEIASITDTDIASKAVQIAKKALKENVD